jgi:molecular chaperone HscC
MVSRVLQQCEKVKKLLSKQDQAEVIVPDRKGDMHDNSPRVAVTREQFQKWTQHILALIELPIRLGLGDANLKRADVHEVILVGGATRMPAVIETVTQIFRKSPHSRLNPDEVVALGAAVQAGLIVQEDSLSDMVVTDVSPFTLGVEVSRRIGMEVRDGYFMPVINRNTTIPVSRVERVSTMYANQTEIRIKVYQGESRRTKDNLLLGEFKVTGVPRGPAGQSVDLRLTYDLNGVLEVEATVVETQKKTGIVITKHARGMSDEQISQAVQEMQHLKIHPREETANRFLLKRAERVYRELPLMERERLSDLMDGFEAALDMNEGEEVLERFRLELEIFLNQYEEGYQDDVDEQAEDEW